VIELPGAYEPPDLYRLDDLIPETERALRDRTRRWVGERFLPLAAEYWWKGTFPYELVAEMAELGAFGGTIRGYGCAGHSALGYGLLVCELERGDTSLRTMSSVQGALCMTAIHRFGSEEQKLRWLPALASARALGCFGLTEPGHGSDPASMETVAERTSAGFVLRGQKMWIGNANMADVLVVWAKLDGVVRGFLVEKGSPGLRVEVLTGKHSLRIADTCRLYFENCEIPSSALLEGSDGIKSPLSCLNHARYSIAWGVIGAAQACYDEARRYALEREQFERKLASFQLVQAKLAHMLTLITQAQLVAWRLAELKEAGRATPAQISLAKRANVEAAIDVARMARDMLGAVGILDRYQTFRHLCNLESVRTYEGTHDMHLLILGREITGVSAFC
jgi:glutaryl-CoA dehydrogenase